MTELLKPFDFHSFQGTFKEIGVQYGKSCSKEIKEHIQLVVDYLYKKNDEISLQMLKENSLKYRKYVLKYTPHFDDLILGLSKGAEIELWEAYLLQLRAEINRSIDKDSHECTSFIALSNTNSENNIISQNVDLPSYYKGLFKVIEYVPDGFPRILMLAPVGQISHIGINEHGLGVAGNFIATNQWSLGLPRYLYSGLALSKENIYEAEKAISSIERASSRNIMMLQGGNAIDLEVLPTTIGSIYPKSNILVHTNHIIADDLKGFELKSGEDLINSKIRLNKAESLLKENIEEFDVIKAQLVLRDRTDYPHSICRLDNDFGEGKTVASFISQPSKGEIWVSPGPPVSNEYFKYKFSM